MRLWALVFVVACDAAPSPVPASTSTSTRTSTSTSTTSTSEVVVVPRYFPKMPGRVVKHEIAAGKASFTEHCARCHQHDLYNAGYQAFFGATGIDDTLEKRIEREWRQHVDGEPRQVGALASFLRTRFSGDAPFDRFEAGDQEAISEAAKRGWQVFRRKAGCTACHVPPLFTDHKFHNLGVEPGAPGRMAVTKQPRDAGRFKTPSLRSVSKRAPYFHDGSAKTLSEAVDFVLGGGRANANLDSGITKIVLTVEQRADLLEFLRSLDGAP